MTIITLVGVFDTMKEAQQARSRLQEDGVSDASIRVESGTGASASTAPTPTAAHSGDEVDRRGFWDKMFGWMSDDENDDGDRRASTRHYDEAVRRGNALVMVSLDDPSHADHISDLLNQCGAVDVDERVAQWRTTGYDGPANANANATATATATPTASATAAGSADGNQTLQSIEEQLKVGKHTVQRGRVRIHRTMSERPAEEQVSLHDERVHVERKPVDRAATEADLSGAFEDRDIELTETTEEAVVAKTARVVEEVQLRTEATDRIETVHGTVRKTEIDVEKVDDGPAATRSDPASGQVGHLGRSGSSGSAGDLGKSGQAAGSSRMAGGAFSGSAGGGYRAGKGGYGGAERRGSADASYRGPERRMSAA